MADTVLSSVPGSTRSPQVATSTAAGGGGTPVMPATMTTTSITPPNSTASVQQTRQIPLTCSGHTRPVVQLQFSALTQNNGYLLISACKDGMPQLRDGITGDWLGTFLGHKGAVWCARLNRDASRAVTASADFSAKLWNTYSGAELLSFGHRHIVRSADFINESHIVTGGSEKVLRIFDLSQAGRGASQCDTPALELEGHQGTIRHVCWDQARSVILSSGEDRNICVWDLRTPTPVHTFTTDEPIASMDLSGDGSYLTCTAGNSVKVWDAQSRQLVKSYTMPYAVSSVAIHPQHQTFVTGGRSDLWVRVYDFESGKEIELYKGHHGPVHAVSYSPDGELYATGSEDGTIRLWQTTPGKAYGLWQTRKPKDDALYYR